MTNSDKEEEDYPWDAFGDDTDDDDQDNINNNNDNNNGNDEPAPAQTGGSSASSYEAADRVASHLAKTFFWNKKSIKLGIKRRVGIVLLYHDNNNHNNNNDNAENNDGNDDDANKKQEQETWETTLTARGFAMTFHTVMLENKRIDDDAMILLKKQNQPALDALVFAWATTATGTSAMTITTTTTTDTETDFQKILCRMQKAICPGGVFIVPISSSSLSCKTTLNDTTHLWDRDVWKIDEAEMLYEYPFSLHQTDNNDNNDTKRSSCLWAITKYACPIQSTLPTCTWLPLHYSVQEERQRVAQATICLSADEVEQSKMVESSIQQAVQALQEYGYCVVPRLLSNTVRDLPMIHAFSHAAREDLHEAAGILKQRDSVDLYHPHESRHEPATYREMSMREDFRMDLRHGPRLSQLRGGGGPASSSNGNNVVVGTTNTNNKSCQTAKNENIDDIDVVVDNDENDGNFPWIVKATTRLPGAITCNGQNDTNDNNDKKFHAGYFLRGHVDILEIVRRTMNPTLSAPDDPGFLSRGNFGRYNFAGSGPDGSFQNLRVSPVGAIISLPGSADQAIHADTPHLFEHVSCLPAHYINVFTPGIAAAPGVGQTALVHASHTLEFCARFMNDGNHSVVTDKNKSGNLNKKEKPSWKDFLVRPALDLGDVLLFDCRILHFGLANSSGGGDNGATTTGQGSGVERPLLYTNMTQHWFHDPKNWQDQRPIFGR